MRSPSFQHGDYVACGNVVLLIVYDIQLYRMYYIILPIAMSIILYRNYDFGLEYYFQLEQVIPNDNDMLY